MDSSLTNFGGTKEIETNSCSWLKLIDLLTLYWTSIALFLTASRSVHALLVATECSLTSLESPSTMFPIRCNPWQS
jgi:hypothetical protein